MTDLELQEAVIREIQNLLDKQSLRKPNGEVWKDFNIYRQAKPYKNDFDDERQEDYIIVMLDDEDMEENGDGSWIVMLHIGICITYESDDGQGDVVLANLMNQIDLHLRKLGYIDQKYELLREAHKRFDPDSGPNYFQCDYISKWKLPPIHMEGVGDLT